MFNVTICLTFRDAPTAISSSRPHLGRSSWSWGWIPCGFEPTGCHCQLLDPPSFLYHPVTVLLRTSGSRHTYRYILQRLPSHRVESLRTCPQDFLQGLLGKAERAPIVLSSRSSRCFSVQVLHKLPANPGVVGDIQLAEKSNALQQRDDQRTNHNAQSLDGACCM